MKMVLSLLVFLFVVEAASASIIHGSVYNTYLEPLENAIVKINTQPLQTRVAQDATYSFSVNPGIYTITATYADSDEYRAEENVTISDEGTYTIDLILMPYFEKEDIENDIEVTDKPPFVFSTAFIVIVAFLFIGILLLVIKYRHHHPAHPAAHHETTIPTETDEEKAKILKIIKEAGGRITQKDIRKQSPLSEAKISLIIAELEHENKIKKIKRGRGNIIILQ